MSVCHTDFYYWPFWNDTTKNNGSRVKGALDHPIIPNKTCITIFVSINFSFFSFIYFLFCWWIFVAQTLPIWKSRTVLFGIRPYGMQNLPSTTVSQFALLSILNDFFKSIWVCNAFQACKIWQNCSERWQDQVGREKISFSLADLSRDVQKTSVSTKDRMWKLPNLYYFSVRDV